MKPIVLKLSLLGLALAITSCNEKAKKDNTSTEEEVKVETVEVSEEPTPITDEALTDKKWKLTKLLGKPVSELDKSATNVFVTFSTEENRVSGNSGCNSFGGTYTLLKGNRFTLSKMASTLKACMNMDVEQQFMDVLQKSDTYIVKDGSLQITKAKMAPLAEFELAE